MNGDITGFCMDLNVRETNHHAISWGRLHGPCIKKMACITTIFSAINTTWKQISVDNQMVQIHPQLPSLFAIWIDRNLLPSGFDFEGSTAMKIIASSLGKPQTFFPIFSLKQAVLYGVLSGRH